MSPAEAVAAAQGKSGGHMGGFPQSRHHSLTVPHGATMWTSEPGQQPQSWPRWGAPACGPCECPSLAAHGGSFIKGVEQCHDSREGTVWGSLSWILQQVGPEILLQTPSLLEPELRTCPFSPQCSQLLPGQSTRGRLLWLPLCPERDLRPAAGSRVCSKGRLRAAGRCVRRGQPQGLHPHLHLATW